MFLSPGFANLLKKAEKREFEVLFAPQFFSGALCRAFPQGEGSTSLGGGGGPGPPSPPPSLNSPPLPGKLP